jgi:hypothetical protein
VKQLTFFLITKSNECQFILKVVEGEQKFACVCVCVFVVHDDDDLEEGEKNENLISSMNEAKKFKAYAF